MNRHAAPPTVRTSALEELARAAAIRRGRRVELVPRVGGGPVARGVLLRDEGGSALVLWDDGAISGCRTQFLKVLAWAPGERDAFGMDRNEHDRLDRKAAMDRVIGELFGSAAVPRTELYDLDAAARALAAVTALPRIERTDAERRGLHTHAPDGSNRDCKRCAVLRARLGK